MLKGPKRSFVVVVLLLLLVLLVAVKSCSKKRYKGNKKCSRTNIVTN